jgi:hypothetical protein
MLIECAADLGALSADCRIGYKRVFDIEIRLALHRPPCPPTHNR